MKLIFVSDTSQLPAAKAGAQDKQSHHMLIDRALLLEEYAGHVEQLREMEKRDLAKVLHNEFGSTLTALSMRLGIMERQSLEKAAMAVQWEKVHTLLSALAKTARRTQKQLRPASLDVLGIKTALVEHLHEFEEEAGIECTISVPDQEAALDEEHSLALLRMLQEILNNVSQHAQAGKVDVDFTFADGNAVLSVSDNGRGFDLKACDFKHAHGLRSMFERTLYLNGTLELESEPGQGTIIRISLPKVGSAPAGTVLQAT